MPKLHRVMFVLRSIIQNLCPNVLVWLQKSILVFFCQRCFINCIVRGFKGKFSRSTIKGVATCIHRVHHTHLERRKSGVVADEEVHGDVFTVHVFVNPGPDLSRHHVSEQEVIILEKEMVCVCVIWNNKSSLFSLSLSLSLFTRTCMFYMYICCTCKTCMNSPSLPLQHEVESYSLVTVMYMCVNFKSTTI